MLIRKTHTYFILRGKANFHKALLKAKRKRKSHNFAVRATSGIPSTRLPCAEMCWSKIHRQWFRVYDIIYNYSCWSRCRRKAGFLLWPDFFPSWRLRNQHARQGAQILDLPPGSNDQGARASCRGRLFASGSQRLFSPSLSFRTELGGAALLFPAGVFALAVPCLEPPPPKEFTALLPGFVTCLSNVPLAGLHLSVPTLFDK